MTLGNPTFGKARPIHHMSVLIGSIYILNCLSLPGCLGGGSMNDMLTPEKLDVLLYRPQEHLETTANSKITATPEISQIVALIETKKYREALQRTTERIESGTDHQATLAEFYLLRGVSNYLLHENELAIDDYFKAIELDPSDWRPLFHRWMAHVKQGNNMEANNDRELGRRLNPELFSMDYSPFGGVI